MKQAGEAGSGEEEDERRRQPAWAPDLVPGPRSAPSAPSPSPGGGASRPALGSPDCPETAHQVPHQTARRLQDGAQDAGGSPPRSRRPPPARTRLSLRGPRPWTPAPPPAPPRHSRLWPRGRFLFVALVYFTYTDLFSPGSLTGYIFFLHLEKWVFLHYSCFIDSQKRPARSAGGKERVWLWRTSARPSVRACPLGCCVDSGFFLFPSES